MNWLLDGIVDAAIDTAKLLPFLFITYLVMEWLERKTQEKQISVLSKVGRLGPLFGGIVGMVPQCGFSAAAASLYAGGLLTIGTLISVFFSTSDEMLPLLISSQTNMNTILKIVSTKAVIGIVTGIAIDFFLRFTKYKYKTQKRIHDLCEAEHCHCEDEEGSIFLSALIHTIHIALFVFIISLVLGIIVENVGEAYITAFLSRRKIIGVFLTSLIGLIPNCGASVATTQLYLDGMITPGQMMSGLRVSAGVGLLVLFRTNRHPKENIKIVIMLYVLGAAWGLLFELLHIAF